MSARFATSLSLAMETKYYRYSRFQLSPDASDLDDPFFGPEDKRKPRIVQQPQVHNLSSPESALSSTTSSSASLPASEYRLQRSKPKAYKKPKKRTTQPKQSATVRHYMWDPSRSLAHWIARKLFGILDFNLSVDCQVNWDEIIIEAGSLIHIEMLRLELTIDVAVAAVWYATRISPSTSFDWDDPCVATSLKSVLHQLFLLCASLSTQAMYHRIMPLSIWTQNVDNKVEFRRMEVEVYQFLEHKIEIPNDEWHDWLNRTSNDFTPAYTIVKAFSAHSVQRILDDLVVTSMVD